MPPRSQAGWYIPVIKAISTPLGFYVLALLIIETTVGLVLTYSKLTETHVWIGFCVMIAVFVAVLFVVSGLVFFHPTKLLYGKEEHANPLLEPSALKDQIEDLIEQNVKAESLKKNL